MVRHLTASALLIALVSTASAEMTTNFEDQGLGANSYRNNAGASGRFESGGNTFNNSYDPSFGVWSGWTVSTMTDGTTDLNLSGNDKDYDYQYSSVTGGGAGGSSTYAVAFTAGTGADPLHPATSVVNLASGTSPVSIDVTNTAYVFHAIKYGDQFSTPFQSGDYFELTVTGYDGLNGTGGVVDEVDYDLADYRNGLSFVLDSWKTLDLSSLAGSESLRFGVRSTDNGTYGINTPAYFAADDLVTAVNAVPEPASLVLGLAGLSVLVAARLRKGFPVMMRASEGRDS